MRVQGVGCRVKGVGFGVEGLGCGVRGLVRGSGFTEATSKSDGTGRKFVQVESPV